MCPQPSRVYPIAANEIRDRFNAPAFQETLRNANVFAETVKSWPADRSLGLPPQTMTIMTEYFRYEGGRRQLIAQTHHYQQRGIGGFRTDPDPKKILDGDTLYVLAPDD
jgi:hypothetical protein